MADKKATESDEIDILENYSRLGENLCFVISWYVIVGKFQSVLEYGCICMWINSCRYDVTLYLCIYFFTVK